MSSTPINKKTLEYLAELARIELEAPTPKGNRGQDRSVGKKLLKDLQKILAYFEELKEVNTENIEPMFGGLRLAEGSLRPAEGGTIQVNVLREDEANEVKIQNSKVRDNCIELFPEKDNGFLKVPAVFEE